MSLLTDLVAHLSADPSIVAITSQIRIARSHEGDASSRIVVNQISGDHRHHMLGATGKSIARVQFDCYGTTPVNAEILAEAVRQSLDGFRGEINGGVFVSMCHLDDERTQYSPPLEGDNEHGGVDSVQLDYLIGWTVSVPNFA